MSQDHAWFGPLRAVVPQVEAQGDAEALRQFGQERQVEAGPVPGDDDPRIQLRHQLVGSVQDQVLGALEHPVAVRGRHRDGHDGRHRRVEAVDGGVGLYVQAVERRAHSGDRTQPR